MRKPFEEALGDLLAEYADDDLEEIISAMEIALMGLHDDKASKES